MRILWVATKAPWPPVDGGRLLMSLSLQGLLSAGHEVVVVAPRTGLPPSIPPPFYPVHWVESRVPTAISTLCRAWIRGRPFSVQRHSRPEVARQVAACLEAETFDLVHAEQVQSLASCGPAFAAGIPVVWRAQNVESDLWAGLALGGGWPAFWFRREARRMAAYEGTSAHRVSAVVALTARDAARLRRLAGTTPIIRALAVPFPAELPSADAPLPGDPALVLFGSRGWRPNQDGADWFLLAVWPLVRAHLPGAVLHLYTDTQARSLPAGVVQHGAPLESREAFAPGSIQLVPLRTASGIRMKILESWARGLPVVATPEAAAGLDVGDEALLVAGEAVSFAAAIQRLHQDEELGRRLIAQGREELGRRYDPATATQALLDLYRLVLAPGLDG